MNIKRLSLDTALRIGQAAIEKCRKEGVSVTVTVIDRGGDAQVVLRDTLAMDVSIAISKKKAYTAMEFNSPTSLMEDRFKGAYNVPKIDDLLISAGGIPINIAGNIMGGIGVSGAPSGCHRVAQGLDAQRVAGGHHVAQGVEEYEAIGAVERPRSGGKRRSTAAADRKPTPR